MESQSPIDRTSLVKTSISTDAQNDFDARARDAEQHEVEVFVLLLNDSGVSCLAEALKLRHRLRS